MQTRSTIDTIIGTLYLITASVVLSYPLSITILMQTRSTIDTIESTLYHITAGVILSNILSITILTQARSQSLESRSQDA